LRRPCGGSDPRAESGPPRSKDKAIRGPTPGGEHEDILLRQIRAASVHGVLGALLGARYPALAIWSELALSAIGNSWRAWHREVVVLEIGGLALISIFGPPAGHPQAAAGRAGTVPLARARVGRNTTTDCNVAIVGACAETF